MTEIIRTLTLVRERRYDTDLNLGQRGFICAEVAKRLNPDLGDRVKFEVAVDTVGDDWTRVAILSDSPRDSVMLRVYLDGYARSPLVLDWDNMYDALHSFAKSVLEDGNCTVYVRLTNLEENDD